MRLPERLLRVALLALGSVALTPVALADPLDLKPFKASYSAQWKGMTAGASTLELRHAGPDLYTYSSVNTARGMFRLAFPDALTQVSSFRLHEGKVQPLTFRGADDKQRPIDLKFDWQAQRVTGVAKENDIDLALPAGAQDPMSLQIASLRSLAAGEVSPTVWMIDGDRLKEYELKLEGNARIETELGELDTVIYTSRRAGSDRLTRTWVAPALGYLPVKAERIRGRKTEFTLLIQSVDR
jgi:hypothetical protein